MKALILCGGLGSRLFPLSRKIYPKQFVKLFEDGYSLYQLTLKRTNKFLKPENIYLILPKEYEITAKIQAEEINVKIPDENYIIEPSQKDTLPAISYGSTYIYNKTKDPYIFITPSDHYIEEDDENILIKYIKNSNSFLEDYKKGIILYGIKPTNPNPNYGYIELGNKLNEDLFEVKNFKEKPSEELARKYIKSKKYLWNSGMFFIYYEYYQNLIKKEYSIDLLNTDDIEDLYKKLPKQSIDRGILEKYVYNLYVYKLNIKWYDLGIFDSFFDLYNREDVITNTKNYLNKNSKNILLFSENKKKYYCLNEIEDLIIVDSKDILLICKKGKSKDIKEIYNILQHKNPDLIERPKLEYRPWGYFEILYEDDKYKVKKLCILPGKQISYQLHWHRNEHWIVAKGTAKVIINDKEYIIKPGESIYVKIGEKHKIENPGKIPLEIIEVQLGEYLKEDDIVRFNYP